MELQKSQLTLAAPSATLVLATRQLDFTVRKLALLSFLHHLLLIVCLDLQQTGRQCNISLTDSFIEDFTSK